MSGKIRFSRAVIPLLLFALLLAAGGCGPAATPPAATALPTGAATTSALPTSAPAAAPGVGNAANGKQLFASLPCSSCHDVTKPYPGGDICPNLGNVATMAAEIVKSPDYHGKATDAAGYIHESIVDPNAYIVPGAKYRNPDGSSVMPKDFSKTLTPSQIDDLVAYLMTLR